MSNIVFNTSNIDTSNLRSNTLSSSNIDSIKVKTTSTSTNNKIDNKTDVEEVELTNNIPSKGKIDISQIDFSKIATSFDDVRNNRFLNEDYILKEYWKDMTYSINNEGIVSIYKGDTLMGLTTKDSIKFNNNVDINNDAYNKVKDSMTDKVINGVRYGGAGNAPDFAISGYSYGTEGPSEDIIKKIEKNKSEKVYNKVKENVTDKVVNGVRYGGAGNAPDFAISGYTYGMEGPSKEITKIENEVKTDEVYNKVKDSMTDKVVNGVRYGGAGNAPDFAVSGYTYGLEGPSGDIEKKEIIQVTPIENKVSSTRPWWDIAGNFNDGIKKIGAWIGENNARRSINDSRREIFGNNSLYNVIDEVNDFNNSTLVDIDKRINYSKKDYLSDGVAYYVDDFGTDKIIKRVVNGDVELNYINGFIDSSVFKMINGDLANKKVITVQGVSYYYYDNKLIGEEHSDGTFYVYDSDGNISYRCINNENNMEYYNSSNLLMMVDNIDGTKTIYSYFDGTNKVKSKIVCDIKNLENIISEVYYYENGKIEHEKLEDGSENYYCEDGRLMFDTLIDGTKIERYSNGNLKIKIKSDGVVEEYSSDDKLISIKLNEFVKIEYNDDMTIKSINDDIIEYGNCVWKYDGDKNIILYNKYDKNQLYEKRYTDGSVKQYSKVEQNGIFDVNNISSEQYGGNQMDFSNYTVSLLNDSIILSKLKEYFPYASMEDYELYLNKLCSDGCGYTAMINTVFDFYHGKEEEFERIFGFPMYTFKDGNINYNYEYLILDYYNYVNGNLGYTIQELYGDIKKNAIDGSITGDFGNGKAWGFSNDTYSGFQKYLKNRYNINVDLDEKYLISDVNKGYYNEYNSFDYDNILVAYNEIKKDNNIVVIGSGNYNLYDYNQYVKYGKSASYSSENGGGHCMTITGVTEDGNFIVSSWGKKYVFDIEGTKKNQGNIDLHAVNYS